MKETKFSVKKKILASASMLTVSAIMLSSATYAWFTMNKEVSVNGMSVKATAENGLVIADYTLTGWASSKTFTMSAAALAPTSTDGASSPNWATASSSQFDNAESNSPQGGGYYDITLTYDGDPTTGEGIGSATRAQGEAEANYVLLRKFYIKGTGDAAWAQNLVIKSVTAAVTSTNTNSGELDKSLRVLVVVGSDSFIYAPITGYDPSCKYKGTGSDLTLISSTTTSTCTHTTSIPSGNTNTPIEADIYVYFEGEDENCKSSNISGISVDDLTITATFTTADLPTTP